MLKKRLFCSFENYWGGQLHHLMGFYQVENIKSETLFNSIKDALV